MGGSRESLKQLLNTYASFECYFPITTTLERRCRKGGLCRWRMVPLLFASSNGAGDTPLDLRLPDPDDFATFTSLIQQVEARIPGQRYAEEISQAGRATLAWLNNSRAAMQPCLRRRNVVGMCMAPEYIQCLVPSWRHMRCHPCHTEVECAGSRPDCGRDSRTRRGIGRAQLQRLCTGVCDGKHGHTV